MNFFNQNKIVILRSAGALMLVVGFATHFWTTPKEGLSANERAAANVARMEARVSGNAASSSAKKNDGKYLKELKETQAKQLQYLTILAMVLGVASLGYSFLPKRDEES